MERQLEGNGGGGGQRVSGRSWGGPPNGTSTVADGGGLESEGRAFVQKEGGGGGGMRSMVWLGLPLAAEPLKDLGGPRVGQVWGRHFRSGRACPEAFLV